MFDQAKFEEVVKPLIKYLAENHHPHVKVIVDSTCAEMVEGMTTVNTDEYLRD